MHASPYTFMNQRRRPDNEAPCSPVPGLSSLADQHKKTLAATQQDRIKTLEFLRGKSLSAYEALLCWWYGTDYVEQQIQQAQGDTNLHAPC